MKLICILTKNFSFQGAGEIFNHLVDNIKYSPERVASAYELIGRNYPINKKIIAMIQYKISRVWFEQNVI